jgi:hypothetical protein
MTTKSNKVSSDREWILNDIKEYVEDGNSWIEVCEAYVGDVGVHLLAPDVHQAMKAVLDNVSFLSDTIGI